MFNNPISSVERLFYVVISFILLGQYCASIQPKVEYVFDKDDYYRMFTTSLEIVKENYYDGANVKYRDLLFGGIKGIFEATEDPYAEFFPPVEHKEFTQTLEGTFGGIGIVFSQRLEKLLVRYLVPNSPASKQGILPGDEIYMIEGNLCKELKLDQVIDLIRGPINTFIDVVFLRDGKRIPKKIKRVAIEFPNLEKTILEEEKIGYLKLSQFSMNVAKEIKAELLTFVKKGIKKVVIDLRDNPGGILGEALLLCNYFIKKGFLLHNKSRSGYEAIKADPKYFVTLFKDIQLDILVDENTASASEIFAGTLQDYGRATIVGTKSFGKGKIQKFTTRYLKNEALGFKLTVAEWFTAYKNKIDRIGLRPDIEVENEKLNLDQKYMLYKLEKNNLVLKFLQKHKDNPEENIDKLITKLKKLRIPFDRKVLLNYIIAEKNYFKNSVLHDKKFDKTLQASIKHLIGK